MRRDISYVAGYPLSSPRNTVKKMAHAYSWYAASYQPAMGATLCFLISSLVSVNEVKVSPSKIASHFQVGRAASEPTDGESSGKIKILIAPPIPSGSLVWNAITMTIMTTAWDLQRGWKLSLLAMSQKTSYIVALDLSFFRVGTVLHVSGSCAVLLTLHSRRRLRRSAPHLSVSVTG